VENVLRQKFIETLLEEIVHHRHQAIKVWKNHRCIEFNNDELQRLASFKLLAQFLSGTTIGLDAICTKFNATMYREMNRSRRLVSIDLPFLDSSTKRRIYCFQMLMNSSKRRMKWLLF